MVNPVDSSATAQMTKLIQGAKIPLVYVNRQPLEPLKPGEPVVYVGSDENVSGKLEGEAIAKLLNNKGNVVIMMGELATQAAALRTEGVEKVVAQHPEMKIVQKQTANWRRNEAIDLMNNWLVAGTKVDAVAANNDEMAIGAIIALQQAGKDPKKIVIGGVDATRDALSEMEKGNLAVTVFQDAKVRARLWWIPPPSSSRARSSSPLMSLSRSCLSPRRITRSSSTSDARSCAMPRRGWRGLLS